MTVPALKPCTYRKAQAGFLVCTIAEVAGERTSKYVSSETCKSCNIPEKLSHANCQHFQAGTEVIRLQSYGGGEIYQLADIRQECSVLSFQTVEEMDAVCGPNCPSQSPIHRNVSQDEPVTIADLPGAPTERDIRQAVLLALHEYNGRHTERYGCFDVTPDFLARSLNLQPKDIYRVLGPMAEADEVRTIKATRAVHPEYVTITAKGIEAITTEPLFENKGIRMTNDNRIQIQELKAGQIQLSTGQGSNTATVIQGEQVNPFMELLTNLKKQVETTELSAETRQDALGLIDIVFEEVQAPAPRQNRVETSLRQLTRLLEKHPALTSLGAGLIQAAATLFAQ